MDPEQPLSQTALEPPPAPPVVDKPPLNAKGGGVLADRLFRWLCVGAGVLVLAILALILLSTTKEAFPAVRS